MRPSSVMLLAVSLMLPLAAQTSSLFGRLSVGVTGGLPLNSTQQQNYGILYSGFFVNGVSTRTSTLRPYGGDTSRRYTVGPNMEFAVTDHFSVQFNPLYRRFRYELPVYTTTFQTTTATETTSYGYRTVTNALEFPLIAKYYFGSPDASWRFFAGTGYSIAAGWQNTRGIQTIFTSSTTPALVPFSSSYRTPTQVGAVFSEGASWKKGRWTLAPELRYTRWGNGYGDRHQNQFDLLLNVRF